MCAACVAQGVTYLGGAVGVLQVMASRARHRRLGDPNAGSSSGPLVADEFDVPPALARDV